MIDTDHLIPGSIITVRWFDAAWKTTAWCSPSEAKEFQPAKVHSVGFLVIATDTHITLSTSVNSEQVGGVFTIPKGWIEFINVLQEGHR